MGMTEICWARNVRGLSSNAHNVLNSLAGAADDAPAFPSIATLEIWTSLSRRSVFRALEELQGLGLVVTIREAGKPNQYELIMDGSATQTLVPHGHQCHTDTQLVPHGHSTSATVAPKRFLKALKEKHIHPDAGLAVSVAPAQKPKRQKPKGEYTRQSATWVEPEPAQEAPSDQAARMEAIDLWRRVQAQLKLELPGGTYDSWVQRAYGVRLSDNELVIAGTNLFQVDMLKNRLRMNIERAIRTCSGRQIALGVVQPGH